MEHIPSWEANRPSFNQEISMFHYHIHKHLPPLPILTQSNQSMSPHPISCKSILILSSCRSLVLPSGTFPQVFSLKPCIQLSCSPFVPHALTILLLTWSPEYYLVTGTGQNGPWLTTYKISVLVVWNQNTFIFCIWLIYLSVSVNASTSFLSVYVHYTFCMLFLFH